MRPFIYVIRKTSVLSHSAKGSTWEDHKYIKRVDGTYYYPDNYEGGRHISDLEENDSNKSEKLKLTSNDISKLSDEVIYGRYGNGQTRKDLLGDNYQEVQDEVNRILGSGVKMSDSSAEKGKKEITK